MSKESDKKRIVFFIGSLQLGGAERVLSILANSLIILKYEVTIILYYDREICYELNNDIKIIEIEKETKSSSYFTNMLFLRKYIQRNADIVVSFLTVFNIFSILTTFNLHIPIIVSNRSDPNYEPRKRRLRMLRNFLYRFSSKIIVQTTSAKRYFPFSLQDKIVEIANPISGTLVKGEALLQEKEKKIVAVGRLIQSKNQLLLINAFTRIANKYADYELHIYGDGEYKAILEKQINDLNMSDRIILMGEEKNIFDKIKNADVFVLTSNYEGMPNSLLEAMCLGLPVVATRVAGAEDFIVSGENGLLVDCNDQQGVELSLEQLLDNPKQKETIAKNAVEIYEELRESQIINKWIKVLEEASL